MTARLATFPLLAGAAIVLGACGSSSPPLELAPDLTGERVTLSSGDSIRIEVWRYDEYSGQFGVAPDGTVAHPLYQSIQVSSIPVTELDAAVAGVLREFIDEPVLVVEPLLKVVVVGDVERPGTYAVVPTTTLVQAVARAGGPALTAKMSKVKLIRNQPGGGVARYEVDFTDPASVAFRATIRSGDQIVVPAKTFTTGLWIALIGAASAVLLVIERFTRD